MPNDAQYDVGEIIRRVQQKEFPPGTETPVRLMSLWNATMEAWRHLRDRYLAIRDELPEAGRLQFEKDVSGFEARMGGYHEAIQEQIDAGHGEDAEGRNALLPTVINGGFLLNVKPAGAPADWRSLHLPDFASPFTFANQFDELAAHEREAREKFWAEIRENALRVPSEILETVARVAATGVKSVASGLAKGLGTPVMIGLGVLGGLWLFGRSRR